MTDQLTAKQLVERLYMYVDKLTKECRKDIMGNLSKEKPANPNDLARVVSNAVLDWFGRRDRYIRIMFDPRMVKDTPEPGIMLTFTGENKDATFNFSAHITYYMAGNVCYAKNINFNVDKRDFMKRD